MEQLTVIDDIETLNKINLSNSLTRAGHGLTLAEKRLVFCAISKLDSRRVLRPGETPVSRVSAAEYADVAECEPSAAYEALQTAAKNLYNRSISFFVQSKNRQGKLAKETITHMRWVGRATYKEKEGWVELAWWHEVLPHLFGLEKEFTQYKLQQTHALRSTYSWKLLELLSKFKSTGVAQYTVDDFATAMDATDKQRTDFASIRRKIIEPAIKELQEKDGWEISWEQIKAGRKVVALKFTFVRKLDLPKKPVKDLPVSCVPYPKSIEPPIAIAPNEPKPFFKSSVAVRELAKIKSQADSIRGTVIIKRW